MDSLTEDPPVGHPLPARRRHRRVWLLAGGAVLALVVALVAVLTGAATDRFRSSSGRPSCGLLTSARAVEEAVARHAHPLDTIRSVGPGVSTAIERPCGSDDRALLVVHCSTDEECARVNGILGRSSGLGVPVQVQPR